MTRANQCITSLETALDLAIRLEQHGQAYYREAAARADLDLQPFFRELADQEARHAERYRRLYCTATGKDCRHDQLLGEYGRFIDLLTGEIVRALTDQLPTTRAELLALAVQFEKDTLLYFEEIKSVFGEAAQAAFEEICVEERRHLARLLELSAAPPK